VVSVAEDGGCHVLPLPEDILARAHAALVAESKAPSASSAAAAATAIRYGGIPASSSGGGGGGGSSRDPWDFYSLLEESEHGHHEAVELWHSGGGVGGNRRLSSEFISVAYRYTNLAWRGGSAAAAAAARRTAAGLSEGAAVGRTAAAAASADVWRAAAVGRKDWSMEP
jgi:hypothetical protein